LYRIEYKKAYERFEKNYRFIYDKVSSMNTFDKVLWEFPKGKMFSEETPLQCSLREFQEETNVDKNNIMVIKQANTFEDYFIGNDNRKYQSVYYLGYIDDGIKVPFKYNICPHQMRAKYVSDEVMSIEWFSYKDALEKCSPTKQVILKDIYNYIYGNKVS
jgi:8-oxo-dGTP pyrophosphatase MutT (NUDIX family)